MMINLLPTEDVLIKVSVNSDVNEFGEAISSYESYEVSECLVEYPEANEMNLQMGLNNSETVKIHIPKTFKKELLNSIVVLRGKEYKTISAPSALTFSPLIWNRYVICERVK